MQKEINLLSRTFRVVVSKTDEDDGYMANIPSLTYCFAFGDTIDESITNLREALIGTLETMEAKGIPIIDDCQNLELFITVPKSTKKLEFA